MTKQLLCYNDTIIGANSTPTANQVPILNNDASLTLAGAGLASTGAALSTILQMTGVQSVTSNTTLDGTKNIIRLDASGGVLTATLPPAAAWSGLILFFKRINASNLPTIKGNGSENIDGANTYTGLSAQYKAVILYCNGTSWDILAGF